MLIFLFLFSLTMASESKDKHRLILSDIVTFNTPSYVEGLFADTHSLGLSVHTDHVMYSGLKLVNEAFVHFDPKKNLLRTLVSHEGFVGVFSGSQQIDGTRTSIQGASYMAKEGDLIVMVASWTADLEIDHNHLIAAMQRYTSTVDIADHFLESLEHPDEICFIFARVVKRADIKPNFIRLRKQERQVSSDSFEGPAPLKPIGSGTLRLPSLVLGWSSEEDFDQNFAPKETETDLEQDSTVGSANVFASDQQRRRRRDRENCRIQ